MIGQPSILIMLLNFQKAWYFRENISERTVAICSSCLCENLRFWSVHVQARVCSIEKIHTIHYFLLEFVGKQITQMDFNYLFSSSANFGIIILFTCFHNAHSSSLHFLMSINLTNWIFSSTAFKVRLIFSSGNFTPTHSFSANFPSGDPTSQ